MDPTAVFFYVISALERGVLITLYPKPPRFIVEDEGELVLCT
jgi:hypothetical protein